MTRAVFFDVDFTLIYPGPSLQGEGYGFFCARHGVAVDTARFRTAVGKAAPVLDEVKAHNYDAQLFIDYTRAIIEHMGGRGPGDGRSRPGTSTTSGRPAITSSCTTTWSRPCGGWRQPG